MSGYRWLVLVMKQVIHAATFSLGYEEVLVGSRRCCSCTGIGGREDRGALNLLYNQRKRVAVKVMDCGQSQCKAVKSVRKRFTDPRSTVMQCAYPKDDDTMDMHRCLVAIS